MYYMYIDIKHIHILCVYITCIHILHVSITYITCIYYYIMYIYIHFSHHAFQYVLQYAKSPKCIVDTADIQKTLDIFYIYFFGQ